MVGKNYAWWAALIIGALNLGACADGTICTSTVGKAYPEAATPEIGAALTGIDHCLHTQAYRLGKSGLAVELITSTVLEACTDAIEALNVAHARAPAFGPGFQTVPAISDGEAFRAQARRWVVEGLAGKCWGAF